MALRGWLAARPAQEAAVPGAQEASSAEKLAAKPALVLSGGLQGVLRVEGLGVWVDSPGAEWQSAE